MATCMYIQHVYRFTPVPGTRSRLVLTGRAMRKGVDVDDAR